MVRCLETYEMFRGCSKMNCILLHPLFSLQKTLKLSIVFLYCPGVIPSYFLNVEINTVLLIKPVASAISLIFNDVELSSSLLFIIRTLLIVILVIQVRCSQKH